MKPAAKKYMIGLGASFVVFGGLLFLVNSYLLANETSGVLAVMLALVPMIGPLVGLKAALDFIHSMDELQRKGIMDAIIISFILVSFGTFAYSFLEGVGFPPLESGWVFALLVGTMGLAQIYTCWWRYR